MLVAGPAAADDLKILLPIVVPFAVPGAFGSQWTTDSFFNRGADHVGVNGIFVCQLEPCVQHFDRPSRSLT
jgi:imidazole glycerol phosphate synthase subunit HisF